MPARPEGHPMTLLSAAAGILRSLAATSTEPAADPQPGSLQSTLERIDREQAGRAAERLGLVPPDPEPELIHIRMPGPRERLPKTQPPREPIPVPLSDPLLIAAREAAQAYETTTTEWTFEGYNAAIIAAVLPVHDAIRESGTERSTDGRT